MHLHCPEGLLSTPSQSPAFKTCDAARYSSSFTATQSASKSALIAVALQPMAVHCSAECHCFFSCTPYVPGTPPSQLGDWAKPACKQHCHNDPSWILFMSAGLFLFMPASIRLLLLHHCFNKILPLDKLPVDWRDVWEPYKNIILQSRVIIASLFRGLRQKAYKGSCLQGSVMLV